MEEKTFILYWLDGKEETVKGRSIREAFTNAGYGAGALRALDYYKELKEEDNNETCS